MIVMESRHVRRFVVRVDRGEDVVASIKKLAQSERFRAAWVRGTGLCEWVEVTDWDPSREALRAPRHLDGPLALLTCEGNVSMRLGEPYVELRATLSREGDTGLVVLGGQLVVAAALNVELLLEVLEDVRLERDEERETGLSVWKGERTHGVVARRVSPVLVTSERSATRGAGRHEPRADLAPARAPEAPAPTVVAEDDVADEPVQGSASALGWADVARASERAEGAKPAAPSGDRRVTSGAATGGPVATVPIFDKPKVRSAGEDDEPQPKKGDYVDHRQFGLCRVDGENVDGGLLIRLASGMRKVVHIDTLEVLPPRFEGERRIFPLRPRKR